MMAVPASKSNRHVRSLVREFIEDTRPKNKHDSHGVGGRRTALLLRLGLYTTVLPDRLASSGWFVGGRPQTPARLGVANQHLVFVKYVNPQPG